MGEAFFAFPIIPPWFFRWKPPNFLTAVSVTFNAVYHPRERAPYRPAPEAIFTACLSRSKKGKTLSIASFLFPLFQKREKRISTSKILACDLSTANICSSDSWDANIFFRKFSKIPRYPQNFGNHLESLKIHQINAMTSEILIWARKTTRVSQVSFEHPTSLQSPILSITRTSPFITKYTALDMLQIQLYQTAAV